MEKLASLSSLGSTPERVSTLRRKCDVLSRTIILLWAHDINIEKKDVTLQNKDYTEYGTSSETGSAWGDADATVSGVAAHAGGVVLLRPYSFMTRCFTLPDLFAGKMHALVYRSWNKRVKGRDWYDFEWYVRHQIPLNFQHLQARISEFNNESPDLLTFKNIL